MMSRTWVSLFCCCLWSCAAPAESKGCFLGSAEVSMADGTVKSLQDVRVGDAVLSWDDDAQSLAPSTVKAAPTFLRAPAELVEVSLPHATFHATEDHPFWSRGRRGLVSANPNQTAEEYGLSASPFDDGEELEHHRGGAVGGVTARLSRPASLAVTGLRGRRLGAAAEAGAVEVRTLCLEPFHWFYVHGVRVHNKGCFVKTTEVSMASGERKQLQHIRVGDEVLSWDESKQRTVKSTVMVTPTYRRDAAELVEIALPHVTLQATEDHPFWSKRRQGLVSVHPARTLEAYSLAAESLEAGEALEDEKAEAVHVAAVRRLPATAAVSPLRGRLLGSGNGSAAEVDVMTLCLHPHHWYYVHGVRVHNKGCFAPWVRVLLSNGSQVPIEAVQPGDRVASWDSESGLPVNATVDDLETFAPRELYKMETPGAVSEVTVRRLAGEEEQRGLVFTADHPIYSARWQGIVSMRPNVTLASYGIAAGQMLELELVSDHRDRSLEATVRPWHGEQPSTVMTLRLDGHHWFYVEGVRVHNKGGGGYGGGSGGSSFRTRTSFSSRSSYGVYVLGYTRRRRGVWVSGSCSYSSTYIGADGGANPALQSMCTRTIGSMGSCQRCDQCSTQMCLRSIPGCEAFVYRLYRGCQKPTTWWPFVAFLGVSGAVTAFILYLRGPLGGSPALAARRQAREELEGACANGPALGSTQWQGTYSENGETKPTQYQWMADGNGRITGQTSDDDGVATIAGAIQWPQGQDMGRIAWVETRAGMTMEASGTIAYVQQAGSGSWFNMGFSGSSTRPMKIDASYDSSLNVSGIVQLWCGMAPPMPPPGQAAPLQDMAGSPQNVAKQEGQPLMGY